MFTLESRSINLIMRLFADVLKTNCSIDLSMGIGGMRGLVGKELYIETSLFSRAARYSGKEMQSRHLSFRGACGNDGRVTQEPFTSRCDVVDEERDHQ